MTNYTITPTDYISADTYVGSHSRWGIPQGMRADVFTAAELAALAPEGVIWESFGHVAGHEGFGRTRYVADGGGNLHCYDSDGRKAIVHPADRRLRILTH